MCFARPLKAAWPSLCRAKHTFRHPFIFVFNLVRKMFSKTDVAQKPYATHLFLILAAIAILNGGFAGRRRGWLCREKLS